MEYVATRIRFGLVGSVTRAFYRTNGHRGEVQVGVPVAGVCIALRVRKPAERVLTKRPREEKTICGPRHAPSAVCEPLPLQQQKDATLV